MSDDLRQCCTGSDNPANRCGLHHCTDLAMMGGYSCCCGAYWTSKNVCQSGAKTGTEVSPREQISALVWYATCQIDSPHDLDPHVDALMAVRDTELERVSGYAERMAEMVIEKDREATQWAERLHEAEAALAALTGRSQTRDHLADREQELARLRLAHLEKEVVLYGDTNRLIEAELEKARAKFAALDALHPHTELNWWHPCKNHSITDEEPTLAACPNCLIEPVMGCPRCGDDACEIRAILNPDSPDVTL